MRQPYHPDRKEISLPSVLHALSDPLRFNIFKQLAASDAITMQDCDAAAGTVAKSTLSHHFKTLREAGVIRTQVMGTQRQVSLRRDDLEARFPGLIDVLAKIEAN